MFFLDSDTPLPLLYFLSKEHSFIHSEDETITYNFFRNVCAVVFKQHYSTSYGQSKTKREWKEREQHQGHKRIHLKLFEKQN